MWKPSQRVLLNGPNEHGQFMAMRACLNCGAQLLSGWASKSLTPDGSRQAAEEALLRVEEEHQLTCPAPAEPPPPVEGVKLPSLWTSEYPRPEQQETECPPSKSGSPPSNPETGSQ